MNQQRMDVIRKAIEEEEANSGWQGKYHLNTDVLEKAGIGKYRAKVGDNYLTILPQKNIDMYFTLRILVHYSIGVNKSSFICPSMIGEPCPICEKREKLVALGASKEELKPYNFGTRYLFFVVDVESEETAKEGVKLFDAPKSHYIEIKGRLKNNRTGEYIDITDPEDGKDFFFKRVGEDAHTTKYSAYKLEERTFDVLQKWLDTVIEFEDVLVICSYDEINEELNPDGKEEVTRRAAADPVVEKTEVEEEPVLRRRNTRRSTPAEEPTAEEVEVEDTPDDEPEPKAEPKEEKQETANTETPSESVSTRSADIKSRLKARLAERSNKK